MRYTPKASSIFMYFCAISQAFSKHQSFLQKLKIISFLAPVLDLPSGTVEYYRGTIKESDTIATISPEIRVLEETGILD